MATTTTVLTITGMSCNNCVRHVERALRGVAGVTAAQVAIGRATVTHDGDDLAPLLAALDDAGYRATATPG